MIRLKFQQDFNPFQLNIDVTIPETGITAIFGRSGTGKTSIINAISGLNKPDTGFISIGEHVLFDSENKINVPIEKRNIGYVFQEARLFPHYKVKSNLLYGVKSKKRQASTDFFNEIVLLLDLGHLLSRYPSELSGGEKQRCAIARALLSQPDILLMDEPLASLDQPRKQEILPFLERLSADVNIPILYVTHSMEEILHLADHMLILDNGQVQESGDIESMWRSKSLKPWQKKSELSSLFNGTIRQHHHEYALTEVELMPNVSIWMEQLSSQAGDSIRARIYANDVSITLEEAQDSSIRNILPATIVKMNKAPPVSKQSVVQGDLEQPINVKKRGSIEVQLCLGEYLLMDSLLWANITAWAFDDLKLSIGKRVYVQIKGVRLTNKDMARKSKSGATNE